MLFNTICLNLSILHEDWCRYCFVLDGRLTLAERVPVGKYDLSRKHHPECLAELAAVCSEVVGDKP